MQVLDPRYSVTGTLEQDLAARRQRKMTQAGLEALNMPQRKAMGLSYLPEAMQKQAYEGYIDQQGGEDFRNRYPRAGDQTQPMQQMFGENVQAQPSSTQESQMQPVEQKQSPLKAMVNRLLFGTPQQQPMNQQQQPMNQQQQPMNQQQQPNKALEDYTGDELSRESLYASPSDKKRIDQRLKWLATEQARQDAKEKEERQANRDVLAASLKKAEVKEGKTEARIENQATDYEKKMDESINNANALSLALDDLDAFIDRHPDVWGPIGGKIPSRWSDTAADRDQLIDKVVAAETKALGSLGRSSNMMIGLQKSSKANANMLPKTAKAVLNRSRKILDLVYKAQNDWQELRTKGDLPKDWRSQLINKKASYAKKNGFEVKKDPEAVPFQLTDSLPDPSTLKPGQAVRINGKLLVYDDEWRDVTKDYHG